MAIRIFVFLLISLSAFGVEGNVRIRRSFTRGNASFGGGVSVSYPMDSRVAQALAEAHAEKYAKGVKLTGKVLRVSDGESFWLIVGNKREKVRLYGLDVPESSQPYEKESKRALAGKIAGKTVTVESQGRDGNDRILGKVTLNDEDVNEWMIASGFAWYALRQSEESQWEQAQERAKDSKLGLWSRQGPIPPWQWRAQRKLSN